MHGLVPHKRKEKQTSKSKKGQNGAPVMRTTACVKASERKRSRVRTKSLGPTTKLSLVHQHFRIKMFFHLANDSQRLGTNQDCVAEVDGGIQCVGMDKPTRAVIHHL